MAIATSQTLAKYYERYKEINVTFTKEVIKATGLVPEQVYIKSQGSTWPCVLYSTSLSGAKIIVNTKSGILDRVRKANNLVNIRWSFREAGKQDPFTFFVAAKSVGFTPHSGSPDFSMLTVTFTQRPPDDLIEIIGRLLDANVNSARRSEERILLTVENIRRLSLKNKNTIALIQSVPRKCILRDLSFSGAKVIMMGVSKFLLDREVQLIIEFEDPRESFAIKGRSVRSESIEGRKDLIALGLIFDKERVPMTYKMRINDFLNQQRTDRHQSGNEKTEETKENPE